MKNLMNATSSSILNKCLNITRDLKCYLTIDKDKIENFLKWKDFTTKFKDNIYRNFKVKINDTLSNGEFTKEVNECFEENFLDLIEPSVPKELF
jgi:hypothetical protein